MYLNINYNDLKKFPFGKLREGLNSLQRADLVVFTKHNLRASKSSGVTSVFPLIKKWQIPYMYSDTLSSLFQYSVNDIERLNWSSPIMIQTIPEKQKLWSFCGIGDPLSFEQTTRRYQGDIIKQTVFSDHYNYHQNEANLLDLLQDLYAQSHITGILTTQKDFIKIKQLSQSFLGWCHRAQLSFFVLDIEMNWSDEDLVLKKIKNLIL